MGTKYAMIADIMATVLFFYMPGIYFLTPRKGKRYVVLMIFSALYLLWEIPTRYSGIFEEKLALMLALNHIWLLLLIFVLYNNSWKRKMLCWGFILGISLLLEFVAGGLLMLVNPTFMQQYLLNDSAEDYLNMGHLMSLLANEVLNAALTLIYLLVYRIKRWKPFLGFFVIPVYQLFIMLGYFMLINDYSEKTAMIGLLMGIFNFLLDGIVLYLLEAMFSKLHQEEELYDLQKQQFEEYAFFRESAGDMERIRAIRHDLGNQLQVAYSMMDDGNDPENVKQILEKMKDKLLSEEGDAI